MVSTGDTQFHFLRAMGKESLQSHKPRTKLVPRVSLISFPWSGRERDQISRFRGRVEETP